ncbi:hypothetical protein D3C72_1010360 [compost metagenome]
MLSASYKLSKFSVVTISLSVWYGLVILIVFESIYTYLYILFSNSLIKLLKSLSIFNCSSSEISTSWPSFFDDFKFKSTTISLK